MPPEALAAMMGGGLSGMVTGSGGGGAVLANMLAQRGSGPVDTSPEAVREALVKMGMTLPPPPG